MSDRGYILNLQRARGWVHKLSVLEHSYGLFTIDLTLLVMLPEPQLKHMKEGLYALADVAVWRRMKEEYDFELEAAQTVAFAAHNLALDTWKAEVEKAEAMGRRPPAEPKMPPIDVKSPYPDLVETRRTIDVMDKGEPFGLVLDGYDGGNPDEEGREPELHLFLTARMNAAPAMLVKGENVRMELKLAKVHVDGEKLLQLAGLMGSQAMAIRVSTEQTELPLSDAAEDQVERTVRKAVDDAQLSLVDGMGEVPTPGEVFQHARVIGVKNALDDMRDFASKRGLTVSINGRQLIGGGE
jgi:hypothetical protein